jgi:ArsR family transcriptional regulator
MHEAKTVTVLKALADPTRLKLVRQLAACLTGEKSCGDLSAKTQLSQPAMSHHFTRLVSAGVVVESKTGTHKYYELNRELLAKCGIDANKL